MKLDSYKELYPVVYGETAIKPLRFGPLKKSTYCFGPHWHNRIEFIRVIKGSINILIKDETKVINEGELAIICPCLLHEGRVLEDKTEYYVIMFDIEEFYNSTVASKNFLEPLVQTNITFNSFSKEKEIIDVIDKIYDILTLQKKPNTLIIHGLLFMLLGLLYEKASPKERVKSSSDEKFNSVIEYINEHYTERLTTKRLSEIFGYDEAYFCRRFKKITGITAMKYINILRLEKAQHLLKKTNSEIALIASLCGFSDISYFAQIFHTHYGMSPTDFRKKQHSKG